MGRDAVVIIYVLIAGLWQAVGTAPVTPPAPPVTATGYGAGGYGQGPYGG